MQSLDLFIAKQRLANEKNKIDKLKGLDLSLTGQNLDQNSTFFSLNDSRPIVKQQHLVLKLALTFHLYSHQPAACAANTATI